MKKNKVFEVQLTNTSTDAVRPIEDSTFYTSDTEAFLNFRATDPEFTFDGATIALLNLDDASIVERQMIKEGDDAVYEMEQDVIAHYGNWQAQVLFRKGAEIYTSPTIRFVVERYLMDDRPPRIEDVMNWSQFYESARATAYELERLLEVASGLEEAAQNENARKSAETARVTAENARATAESTRVSQETARQNWYNLVKDTFTRRYAVNIGNNSAKEFTITHNLNTTNVVSQVYLNNEEILPASRVIVNANQIKLTFASVWGTNQLKVVVIG